MLVPVVCCSMLFVVVQIVRENKQSKGNQSKVTREAERRHERSNTERIGAASLKHVHAGTITLLALVGSEVIGLAVGAWLGVFVEGD
jgi:hypothetical protein